MKKKQIITLIVIIVLLFSGFIVWIYLLMKPAIRSSGELLIEPPVQEEMFGLTGWVLEADVKNNFLIIESEKDKKEIKASVSKGTKLLRIEWPVNYPGDEYVITTKTPMRLADFQRGDYISLRTQENIFGKTEFNGIIQIHFYPHFAKLKEY